MPEHCVWPGAQTPPQDAVWPVTRHVELVHVEGVPQAPVAEHVATALIGWLLTSVAHSVAPGLHTPWHEAEVVVATHAALGQVTGAPSIPLESHVWMAELPEQYVCPGLHVPWHDAVPPLATHAEFAHATAAPQFPFVSQVSTPWAAHCVAPGTHCPTHAPPTQAEFAQATGCPKVPLELQVSTPLFEQVVVPGEHWPTHAPLTHA